MFVPVRADAVITCGSADGPSVVSDGSTGGCSAGRSPEGADTRTDYGGSTWAIDRSDHTKQIDGPRLVVPEPWVLRR